MSIIADFLTAGTLAGIALLAVKTGIGCGLSDLRFQEMLCFAFVYALAALLVGAVVGVIPLDLTEQVIGLGLVIHLTIGMALVYFGIRTKQQWLSERKDISRRTFLLMSLPCPACLAATFLSCLVLTNTTGISGIAAGTVIGVMLFAGIAAGSAGISWIATKTGMKNPSTLGNVMLFLGLFYLLCPLAVPAYLQAQNTPTFSITTDPSGMLTAFGLMAVLILLGILIDRIRHPVKYGGK
jgi:predicted transporter